MDVDAAGGTITTAKLYWKLHSDTVWSNSDLVPQGGDQYSVAIGGFPADTEIDYYVVASDAAGGTEPGWVPPISA